jgi:dihydroorotate dehydrogenase (fumarate)
MDLTTTYLGLELRNPLIASASPLSNTIASIKQLADSGVGAIVLYSLFEEQLRRDTEQHGALARAGTESFAEALSYFPEAIAADGDGGLRHYVSLIERAVAAVDVPVIASLNGITPGGWTDFATALEQAGAAAIELNIYHPLGNPPLPGRDVEQRYIELLTTVKAVVSVPVAVKLHPYFSSMAEMAHRLDAAGADGLVLFNRFMQPDIDAESLKVTPWIGLSTPSEARLPRA